MDVREISHVAIGVLFASSVVQRNEAAYAGNLVHVLPFVCKFFQRLCSASDSLWFDAIVRLMRAEPDIWRSGVLQVLEEFGENNRAVNSNIYSSDEEAVRVAARTLDQHSHLQNWNNSGMRLFRYLVRNHLKISASIFYMPGHVRLNREVGLHFFEPRYRFMIAEVMKPFEPQYWRGVPIPIDALPLAEYPHAPLRPPQFIYGTHPPLDAGSPAVLVQVRQCHISRDGSADVLLIPIAHGWFQNVSVRPNTRGLCFGTLIKMPKLSSIAMDHQVQALERQQYHPRLESNVQRIEDLLQALVAGFDNSTGGVGDLGRQQLIQQLAEHGYTIQQNNEEEDEA